jgi:hypothetical protein
MMRRAGFALALALLAAGSAVAPASAATPAAGGAPGPVAGANRGPVKGPPPLAASQGARAAATGGSQFFYGSVYQYGTSDGAWGFYTVTRPSLSAADSHTLAEMNVSSADTKQAVEIGFTVDRGLYGDDLPRLFTFHWVDGQPICYNCGLVQYSPTIRPGMALDVGSTHQFTIRHFQGNWWIGYDLTWVGYYPDSWWGGRYTQAGLIEWYGEVATSSSTPCSDMGNGLLSSSLDAARIMGIGYWNGPALNLTVIPHTYTQAYSATIFSENNIRYGGPGFC